ncbi:MAG: DMT family transporter [Herpetosiphon sp.]
MDDGPAGRRPWVPQAVLLGGVLMVSTAAILIGLAHGLGVPSLTIAAGRLAIAASILTPYTLQRHRTDLQSLAAKDWALAMLAGALLAVHFASWISSLAYTSVASSTALVATNPVFVGLASILVFKERLKRPVVLGILLSVVGSALIGLSDRGGGHGQQPLVGDLLALLGAICASGYFLVGRELRKRVALVPYVWLVYGVAAVVLLIWMVGDGQSLFELQAPVYLLLLLLALGPQLLGHTAFNWSLKYLSATFVTVGTLGEPVGSALFALIILPNQQLAVLQILGGLMLLLGIGSVSLGERAKG